MNRSAFSHYFFALLTVLIFCACSDDEGAATDDPWADADYRREFVQEHRKERYDISEMSPSQKEAVESFLNSMAESGQPSHLLTKDEFIYMYWPSFPDRFTLREGMSAKKAWTREDLSRAVGMPQIQKFMQAGPVRVEKIEYRRQPEDYHAIRAYFPDDITLRRVATGERMTTNLIPVIIEHNGGFKVARAGPD